MSEKGRVDRMMRNIGKPNIYNELIKQITPTQIPAELVQSVIIFYKNGTTFELSGTDLTEPVPVKNRQSPEQRGMARENIDDIKIFVNTELLAEKIDPVIDELFREFNLL
jgi:hypothetical protein